MSSASRVSIVLVTSAGCQHCAWALRVLGRLGADYPLDVRGVDASSAEGLALVSEHRAALAPLVLVDGRFLCSGHVSELRLRRAIEARLATVWQGAGRGR